MDILILLGVVLVVIIGLVLIIAANYHRVPPSQVMVVYGRKDARMVTNGGVFVIPILETYKTLDITIMTIKQEKDEVYTVSGVPIRLDWVSQVQVDSEDSAIRTAARAFLDKTREEIRTIITETLSANFRAIVGQLSVESIHRDRDSFVQKVQDLARDDMASMGVKILSMGIEEITDDQGYLTAMAAPQIAAVKRDATIAEAEADREARVKAAEARRLAEQAELEAQREILQQREALSIREVEVQKKVGLANATSEQEVQKQKALAVEQQQEAEVLVPARAQRQASEIKAEAERRRLTIESEGNATAIRTKSEADAQATEQKGRAEAAAFQARKEAEAAGQKAEAEALKARLLAEAEGRREIAAATAAEGEINLRQYLIEQITQADIAKVQAIAQAMSGLGNNVRVVQIGNGGSSGNGASSGNTFMDMLMNIPEVAEIFRAKVEALSGEDLLTTARRLNELFEAVRGNGSGNTPLPTPPAVTAEAQTHVPLRPGDDDGN
ncbi:MAG: SPFH domain-containing protein [bacterium]|nr:SPFH domain-containing protein [bacterium]